MSPAHYIDKITIQFSASETHGNAITKTLVSHKDEIQTVLDEVFQAQAPAYPPIVISQLQLNLGTLPATNFQQTFSDRLRTLLARELGRFFTREDVKAYLQSPIKIETSELVQSLRQYLFFEGNDSSQTESIVDPDAYIQALFHQDADRLAELLATAWHDPKARHRLTQLTPETFSKIKSILPQTASEEPDLPHFEPKSLYLIQFYFASGVFPVYAKSLLPTDLERLVREAWEKEKIPLMHYIKPRIQQDDFRLRLAETLSLETLKRIVGEITAFTYALNEWNAWEQVLEKAGVKRAAQTSSGKKMILHYLTGSSSNERMQALYDILRLGFSWQGRDFTPQEIHTLLAAIRQEGNTTAYTLVQNQMPYMEILSQENQRQEETQLADWQAFSILQTNTKDLAAWLEKRYNENPEEVARFIRLHWKEPRVRHSLAFQVPTALLTSVTKLLWSQHASFNHWTAFERNFAAVEKEIAYTDNAIRRLHYLYFEFLYRHGQESWTTDRFTDWMWSQVESIHPDTMENQDRQKQTLFPVWLFKKNLTNDEKKILLQQLLRQGIDSFLAANPGFTKEDMLIFWDEVLSQRSIIVQSFEGHTYTKEQWMEWMDILNPHQRQHLFSVLAPFQYEYLDKLLREIQRYTSQQKKEQTVFPTVATYQVLFQALQESSYAVPTKTLAQRLVTAWAFEGNTLFGGVLQTSYPVLFEVLESLGKKWETQLGVEPFTGNLQSDNLKAEKSKDSKSEDISKSAQGVLSGTSSPLQVNPQSVEVPAVAVSYDSGELIHYYLKTGKLPVWAASTSQSELRRLGEQFFASSTSAATTLLSIAAEEAELYQRLTHLLSPDRIQELQKRQQQQESSAYSYSQAVETQHVEALIFFFTYQQWPWWYIATVQTSQGGTYPEVEEVKQRVLQQHLSVFVEQVKAIGKESEMVPQVMQNISLTDFLRIIHIRFSSVAGFIVTSFDLVSEVIASPITATEIYTRVYFYLEKTAAVFSSRLFMETLLRLVSELTGMTREELVATWLHKADVRMQTDNRFWVIKEMLQQQAARPEEGLKEWQAAEIPKTDTQSVKDLEHFREALLSYIRFGTIPASSASNFGQKEQFLRHFLLLSSQEIILLQAFLIQILSEQSLVENFIRRADSDVLDAVVNVLVHEQGADVWLWKKQVEQFLSEWPIPEAQSVARRVAVGAFMEELINPKERPLSLTAYIERVGEYLLYLGITVEPATLQHVLTDFKTKGSLSTSVIQALENVGPGVKNDLRTSFARLHHYLQSGEALERLSPESQQELDTLLAHTLQQQPAKTVRLLAAALENPDRYQQLQQLLSPPTFQALQQAWKKDKETHSTSYGHDNALAAQRVQALIFFFTYQQWPWWYSHTAQQAGSSSHIGVQELKQLVLQQHLSVFVPQMKAASNERAIAIQLIQDSSLMDFLRLIHLRFPAAAGFVETSFSLIQKAISDAVLREAVYGWVYDYLADTSTEFSSRTFIQKLTNFVAQRTGTDPNQWTQTWLQEAEERTPTDSRFWVLKEMLQAQFDRMSASGTPMVKPASTHPKSDLDATLDAAQYFLQFGILPHWTTSTSLTELKVRIESLTTASPSEVVTQFAVAFATPDMYQRLQQLLSPATLQALQNLWEKGKEPPSIRHSMGQSRELQQVRAFIHFVIHDQWPDWYQPTTVEPPPDKEEIQRIVLQHHLAMWVEAVQTAGRERETMDKLIPGLSRTDFLRILHIRFPFAAGFMETAITWVHTPTLSPAVAVEVYRWVYPYALKSTEFSAHRFLHHLLQLVADKTGIRREEVAASWLREAEEKTQTDPRFWAIKEMLQQVSRGSLETEDTQAGLSLETESVETDSVEVESAITLEHFKEALVSYIHFGTIPFNLSNVFLQKDIFLKQFDRLSPQELEVLQVPVRQLLSNRMLVDAFVRRADRNVLDGLVKILAPERFADLIAWKNEMEVFLSASSQAGDPHSAMLVAARTLLMLLTSKAVYSITLTLYIESVLNYLVQHGLIATLEHIQAYTEKTASSTLFIKTVEKVIAAAAANERHTLLNTLLKKEAKKTEPERITKIIGKVPVQNAGIVIIAPFLYRYFNALKMTADNQFKSEAHACRAVQLLEFLASGKEEMPEHGMVLNRILCGVDMVTPIPPTIELTTEEREWSESLLRGVLQNWDKIKTDSIDALREGFFLRNGHLEETELGWTLEVDRKAMDILVDLIPWSFNLIKLSWMEKSLTTIWQSEQYRYLM